MTQIRKQKSDKGWRQRPIGQKPETAETKKSKSTEAQKSAKQQAESIKRAKKKKATLIVQASLNERTRVELVLTTTNCL